MAEEEDENLPNTSPTSVEEKLSEMERKYSELKSEYVKALDKVKSLDNYIRKN